MVQSNPEEIKATLGVAKSVTITKDDTIILHGNGNKYLIYNLELKSKLAHKSSRSKLSLLKAAMIRRNFNKD